MKNHTVENGRIEAARSPEPVDEMAVRRMARDILLETHLRGHGRYDADDVLQRAQSGRIMSAGMSRDYAAAVAYADGAMAPMSPEESAAQARKEFVAARARIGEGDGSEAAMSRALREIRTRQGYREGDESEARKAMDEARAALEAIAASEARRHRSAGDMTGGESHA